MEKYMRIHNEYTPMLGNLFDQPVSRNIWIEDPIHILSVAWWSMRMPAIAPILDIPRV